MDKIIISDILIDAILGIHPHERETPQPVVVHLTLEVDTRPAAASEDIAQAVNYSAVTNSVIDFVAGSCFYLIETLTNEIARLILSAFPTVQAVAVTVEKPHALAGRAGNVAVRIRRGREEIRMTKYE